MGRSRGGCKRQGRRKGARRRSREGEGGDKGEVHKNVEERVNNASIHQCTLILFIQTLALYKSLTYLLTYLLTLIMKFRPCKCHNEADLSINKFSVKMVAMELGTEVAGHGAVWSQSGALRFPQRRWSVMTHVAVSHHRTVLLTVGESRWRRRRHTPEHDNNKSIAQ